MNHLEECVIGSILLDNSCFPDVLATGINDEHFSPADSDVFPVLVGMYDRGEPIDAVTLGLALIKAGKFENQAGATAGIIPWLKRVPNALHAAHYAEKTVAAGRLRHTGNAIKQLAKLADDPTTTADDVRAQLLATVEADDRLSTNGERGNCFADSLVSHAEFMACETVETYLIHGVMVAGHNLCLAGPPKLGKTMLLADAAVSLGSGTPFLGHFEVPESVPVLMLSGESGEKTLRRYCKVIQDRRGIDGSVVQITWGMQLPALSNPKDLRTLERVIKNHDIRVVIIDPIYLALLKGGGSKTDTHRLMEMGLLLGEISEIGQRTGATIVVCHHANQSLRIGTVMDLRDMNGSGFDAWSRSWILGNRRSDYQNDFQHELVLNVGGSAGHSGRYDVTLDEASWAVTVERRDSVKASSAKDESERFVCELERLQKAVDSHPEGETLTTLRGEANIDNHEMRDRLDVLLKQESIEECEFRRGGKGRTLNGYRPTKTTEQ